MWILLFALYSGNGYTSSASQEFEDKTSCELAARLYEQTFTKDDFSSISTTVVAKASCVPKDVKRAK